VLSDRIVVKVTQRPGESFIDRMIALVEGANRQKTPNEIALNILLRGYEVTTAAKPFGMDEFLARLRAAIRRGAAAADTDEPVIETASFTVDLSSKKVTKNGTEVHLTPTEWGMLEMLVRNRGKLVGREELLKEVWGPAYAKETHYLRVYLAQLLRKLENDPSHPVHLLTEAGMGYRFQE
jgi:two-component system, OmpR family, KDP operon response regulator KdpE